VLDLLATLALAPAAAAAPDVVVTLDNGEFNLPLFTPRWNGKWEKPSAAQEIVSSIARVAGANPRTFTYLPPDQGRLGPGGVWPVAARRPGCVGEAAGPSDPCFCGPGDNCWEGVRPNWYAGASTSLWLTAANVRRTLGASGPRIEVHVTDLFEEDPAGAADPSDSDRCVTEAGVRRAFSALLADADGAALDHLAVGLLRATVDPPPPGGSWGDRYTLSTDPESPGCHRGTRAGDWSARSQPWRGNLLVVVLGFGTAADDAAVSSFLDGLVGQFDTGGFEIELARLREPPAQLVVSRALPAGDLVDLTLEGAGRRPALPCGEVAAEVSLVDALGLPVPVTSASGRCDAALSLALDPREVNRVFLRRAGLDPRIRTLDLHGSAVLSGSADALRERWAAVGVLNDSDRPLPLWTALEPSLFGGEAAARPWRAEVAIAALEVSEVDGRPWGFATFVGGLFGVAAGMMTAALVQRLHAERALRRHWARSVGAGRDPRLQVPLASVLGAAQEEVARSWPLRVAAGSGSGLAVAAVIAVLVLFAYRVLLG
jgi:hypothetical protein